MVNATGTGRFCLTFVTNVDMVRAVVEPTEYLVIQAQLDLFGKACFFELDY